jgi:hypothetical protein
MREKLLLLSVVAMLLFPAIPTRSETMVTFDDISALSGSNLPKPDVFVRSGYEGLGWVGVGVLNAPVEASYYETNGYYYGMASAPNVAYNGFSPPSEIDSLGTNFNFLSVYLTGAWMSNLNIEVQGFRSGNLLYDQTVVAAATNPALFTFNYMDIDRLTFNSFGGQSAGFSGGPGSEQFAMDDFTFEFVPEPSSLLLAAFGGVSLLAFLRRRRA